MRKEKAADYIDRADGEVRLILAELAESAGAVARSWSLALFEAHRDPERAVEHLIDAEIRLDNHVRLELADTLRHIRAALKRFDAELPDDDPSEEPAG
jgi:hypothetical protein